MRKNKRSERIRVTLRFVLALGLAAGLVVGLGILRFHAARLAYYLESINKSIQQYSDEEVVLRQELSALVAPIRVYSYCKENLGMQKVLKAETVTPKIKSSGLAAAAQNNNSNVTGWRAGFAWLFGK